MNPVIYGELCPQCGGDLSWDEIEKNICKNKHTTLSDSPLQEEYLKFEKFFFERIGSKPRAIQRMWARRVLAGYSFAAIAPTGIGKTLFGVMMSTFLAENGKRSYLLVPTTLLLREIVERLKSAGFSDFVYYYGKMKKTEKEEAEEKIKNGKFKILITTTAYLSKNFKMLRRRFFDFIFVDDVDSLLKRSKSLEKVLSILSNRGVLMVSTATGTRGYNTRILREKLNFDIGNMRNAVRNVEDVYASPSLLSEILNKMGSGALIFAPTADTAEKIAKSLGPSAGLVLAENKNAYEDFRSGKLDFLVGVATPYGSLIRGIDMPERIRYVVFYGIPRFKVGLKDLDVTSEKLLITLGYLLSSHSEALKVAVREKNLENIREELRYILRNNDEIEGEGFVYKDGYIIFPDIRTYIQGSGRASRLYAGGITKGASFLLDTDEMLKIFIDRASVYGIEFKAFEEIDVENLKKEIDSDRKKLGNIVEEKDVIKPALFIVESPNKAKHIARFFGKPNVRIIGNSVVYDVAIGNKVLTIAPSLGHTVDLVTDRGYHGVLINDEFIPIYAPIRKCRECGYQFTKGSKCPICGSDNIYHAGEQIKVLRSLAYECEEVIIGTDPDTEGEKIAWDLKNLLSPFSKSIRRAEFHEVTKPAILQAIEESREFDTNLVKAQIVRRIEDRWIGFELSHILWQEFGEKNLSAGRAQTPVLGWIIERYEESKKKREEYFLKGTDVKVPWKKNVLGYVEKIDETIKEYTVAPYTTDEILKDANHILHLGVDKVMKILQTLFESGLITYHRTDSTHVSVEGMTVAKKYLGEQFRGRKWGEEGAHECIRPTRPWNAEDVRRYMDEGILTLTLEDNALKVYDLIFRRFMASQTTGYIHIVRYRITAENKTIEFPLIVFASGMSVKLYPYKLKIYKPLVEGKMLLEIEKREIRLFPYTQADIIRLMKDRGIGRPSTYATIVSKLFLRKYVKDIKSRLIPTKKGIDVYSFLSSNYLEFISEERTRMLEKKMYQVEKGEKDYQQLLGELYEEMRKLMGK